MDCEDKTSQKSSLQFGSVISQEEYYKNVYPGSLISRWPGIGAAFMSTMFMVNNRYMNRPATAGAHRLVLFGLGTYWLLNKVEELHGRYYLGRYKYSLDYLLNCEDISSKLTKPKKFSDPEYLRPWMPYRAGGNSGRPVDTLKA